MPKKPLSTYFRFLGEVRPIVTKQNPGMKITELGKIMAQKYKELPVARKEALNEAYQIEKKKYLQEFEKFKITPEGKEILEKMKQDGKEKRLQKAKGKLGKLKSELGKPTRYPLAYNLFVKEQMSGASGQVASNIKLAADKWKNLSEIQNPLLSRNPPNLKRYTKKIWLHGRPNKVPKEVWLKLKHCRKKFFLQHMMLKVLFPNLRKSPKKVAKTKVKKAAPKKKAVPKKKVVEKVVAKKPAAKKTAAKKKPAVKKEVKKAEPTKAKKKQ